MVVIRNDPSVAPLCGASAVVTTMADTLADKGLAGKLIHKNTLIYLDLP
jgi:hypothetical protein